MARVLIAGAGVGGLATAHQLRRRLPRSDEIVVFDQSAVHTFWPSLLWLMTGTRKEPDVVRPLAQLKESGIQVIAAPITAIDPETKTVVAGDQAWTGDAVVVALGADVVPRLIPGLADVPGNFYTTDGACAVWRQLQDLPQGRIVVLISRVPFKCPAAPYEAAMLMDGFLRKRRRRSAFELSVWAAEAAPMAVAGPQVSQAVIDALTHRDIRYQPNQTVERVDAESRQLTFRERRDPVPYDLLAYVAPHRVPEVVSAAGLAPADGWVAVDPHSLETAHRNVFAIGDVTGIPLALGKPLPKAGVFAYRQGEVVAETIAARLLGGPRTDSFDGHGECFIEMGQGVAGFARGNFYAEPTPTIRVYRSGRHWHAGKVAFERQWWARWW